MSGDHDGGIPSMEDWSGHEGTISQGWRPKRDTVTAQTTAGPSSEDGGRAQIRKMLWENIKALVTQ